MKISEELEQPYSKQSFDRIVKLVGNNQANFDELIIYLKKNINPEKVTWAMSHCVEKSPSLIEKHYDFAIEQIKNTNSQSIERNFFRLLQFVDIPEKYQGEIAGLAFKCLELSQQSGVANKIFAITILYNISKSQPELKNELKILIEDQFPYASTGFQSRGKKILKKL